MKFIKLTQVECKYERDAEGKSVRTWSATVPVLVNVFRVTYAVPKDYGTEITFMDNDESACCVTVKDSFEEVERLLRG